MREKSEIRNPKSEGNPKAEGRMAKAEGRLKSQRDCVLQPRVARNELPWDQFSAEGSTPKGLRLPMQCVGATLSGLAIPRETTTQGSSVRAGLAILATLGFGAESLWASRPLASWASVASAICHLPSAISNLP